MKKIYRITTISTLLYLSPLVFAMASSIDNNQELWLDLIRTELDNDAQASTINQILQSALEVPVILGDTINPIKQNNGDSLSLSLLTINGNQPNNSSIYMKRIQLLIDHNITINNDLIQSFINNIKATMQNKADGSIANNFCKEKIKILALLQKQKIKQANSSTNTN